ncbi:MAG: DUF4864 domain-containing protein [Pseudomonadota bacterium]
MEHMLTWLKNWAAGFFLIATLITCSATAQGISESQEAAVQSVISDQILAFQSRDHNRAFSHAAPSIRGFFKTTDRFIAMVKGGYMPLYDPDSFIFGRNIEISGIIHQEVIATDAAGKQWQAVYTLQKQADGSWKITGVKMEPYKGATT